MTPRQATTEPSPHTLRDLAATIRERRAQGKAPRKMAPRRAQGQWVEADRGHDALATILAQNEMRAPDLVPIRHQRMAASPWNYYRGAAAVMAADLATQPTSGLTVQLCGDAHVLNFGLWATTPSVHNHHGARVVNGKRLMRHATDVFAGWGSMHDRDFYVRQFRDMKIIPKLELIAPVLGRFATACGETLATAHARSGDPVAIQGYIGKGSGFTKAMGEFARRYADQNDRDHAQLVAAIDAGTVDSRGA